jgi:phosphonate transport system substrate-binding protein
MADFLNKQTGLFFEVQVPTSYAATIEALGGCSGNCMAFIPALGYVIAHDKYGVTVGAAAVRGGLNYYFSQFLVARDSGIQSLEDLNGKKWAAPSKGSTSGYLFPLYMLNSKNIQPSEVVEAGGHPQAVTAVYNGSVDFATSFYSPPDLPGGEKWSADGPPEPPFPFKDAPFADEKNNVVVDGWTLKDARVTVFSTAPDVFEKVRILTLSDKIPNDTLSFDKDFPADIRDKIIQGIIAFSEDPDGQKVLSNSKFYAWNSIAPVDDSFYDQVRGMIKLLGMKESDIIK